MYRWYCHRCKTIHAEEGMENCCFYHLKRHIRANRLDRFTCGCCLKMWIFTFHKERPGWEELLFDARDTLLFKKKRKENA